MESSARNIVIRFIAAMDAGDLETALSLADPGIDVEMGDERFRGHDGLRQLAGSDGEERSEVLTTEAAGDRVAVRARLSTDGALVSGLFTLSADGQIVRAQLFEDPVAAWEELE